MKKILTILFCISLTASLALADNKPLPVEDDLNFVEDGSRTGGGGGGSSCNDLDLCGSPAEHENNNSCSDYDDTVLECGGVVYGRACDSDDYYKVRVPAGTIATITISDGSGCDRHPSVKAKMKLYSSSCHLIGDWTYDSFEYENDHDSDRYVIVRVARSGDHSTTYQVTVDCGETTDPCPPGSPFNYCEAPIEIPGSFVDGYFHYESMLNTCCATRVVDEIYSGEPNGECGTGVVYSSGPAIVYELVLQNPAVFSVEVGVFAGGDAQFVIFTDCSDIDGSCVYTSDMAWTPEDGYAAPEVAQALELPAGTYFIATMAFGGTACGDLYLILHSDRELPVELISFAATPSDASVILHWSTASESNLESFEMLRDGALVNRVTASNNSTGESYHWTDGNLVNGRLYHYSLVAVNLDGSRSELGAVEATPVAGSATVNEYALYQNYPNPFNPTTSIAFDLAEAIQVKLTIFNPLGQTVATLVNNALSAGHHTVEFNAAGLNSGLYFYRLEAGDFSAVQKMIYMK